MHVDFNHVKHSLLLKPKFIGCTYIDQHTVKTPKGYKEAYAQYCEGGWQGLGYPVEIGGQGMPQSMTLFHSEILVCLFNSFIYLYCVKVLLNDRRPLIGLG